LGLAATDHAVPFHCSTSVPSPALPTATQDVVDVQLTEESPADPVVAGLSMTVHEVPSHSSCSGDGPAPCSPTATQYDALTHDVPRRMAELTVGVVATVQFDALTIAGTVIVVAPADVTPRRRQVPRTTADRADAARRVRVITKVPLSGAQAMVPRRQL
jgi:hypothetical protein